MQTVGAGVAVFSEVGSSHALALVMGVVAYIGALHLWFWRGDRGESAHAWVAAWCLASLGFLIARFVHINTPAPEVAIRAAQVQTCAALALACALAGFSAALSGRSWSRDRTLGWSVVTIAGIAFAILTPYVGGSVTDVRHDWFGAPFHGVSAAPGMSGLLVLILAVSAQLVYDTQQTELETVERRAALTGVALYSICALLSVTTALRLTSVPLLMPYATLVMAASLNYLLVHRHRRLATELESVVEDVSERAELERDLRQSRKMEAVGQLAAGIAHEINNPMAYVQSNLRMLRDELEKLDSDVRKAKLGEPAEQRIAESEELLDDALDGVARTVRLVREVKEFAHGSAGERAPLSLTDVIDDAIRFASPQQREGVKLVQAYSELPQVEASDGPLRQVFLNLLVNAFQAVGDNGTVRIVAHTEACEVIVRIEDDGCGIASDVRERIFEPFFTTKSAGEGTGLGLYFSYEIVRMHGGKLRVGSKLGEGTAFELRLPVGGTATDTMPAAT